MAEVYGNNRLPGKGRDKLNWVMAHHITTQMALYKHAASRAAIARGVVVMHSKTGSTEIGFEHGDVDYFVVLRDKDPESLAYNKKGSGSDKGGNTALSIETGAVHGRGGIHALKAAFPRAID